MATRIVVVLVGALFLGTEAQAQEPALSAPAHAAVVEGSAVLAREGQVETLESGVPIVPGDRIRTDDGRVQILLGRESALSLESGTQIDLLDDALIRLTRGRVLAVLASADEAARWRIDTLAASIEMDAPGQYLVTALGDFVALSVYHGLARVEISGSPMQVRAGERLTLSPGEPLASPRPFNAAADDALVLWAEKAAYPEAADAAATSYLPSELQVYSGTLGQYGTWGAHDTYGVVWYPRVHHGWRPYSHGYWRHVPRYGVTWIGRDRWSWPTHHFGRWGHAGSRWFWKPGARWSGAWVTWATGPAYVGWSAVGIDGRPFVDPFTGRVDLYAAHGAYDPWFGWTVVPSHAWLGRGRFPAVRPHRLDRGTLSAFVRHSAPPRSRGAFAAPRPVGPTNRGVTPARPGPGPRPRGPRGVVGPQVSSEGFAVPGGLGQGPDPRNPRQSPWGRGAQDSSATFGPRGLPLGTAVPLLPGRPRSRVTPAGPAATVLPGAPAFGHYSRGSIGRPVAPGLGGPSRTGGSRSVTGLPTRIPGPGTIAAPSITMPAPIGLPMASPGVGR
jgi:hypothetical protein